MIRIAADGAPPPLVVAASLTAVEALLLAGYGVSLFGATDPQHPQVAITTGIAFLFLGAGMCWCAWQVTQGHSWARSPIVLAQLITLGTAQSFWGGDTKLVTVGLVVTALVVLVGVFHPASIEHLSGERTA